MTQEQTILIKRSWRLFCQIDAKLVGGVFYEKLFVDQPSLQKLFKSSIEIQSQKLIDMLNVIVMHLDKMDEMTGELEDLGVRHMHYGVHPEHYKAVGGALLWTLKQGLGNDWSKEIEDAWANCFSTISSTMINANHPA